MGHMKDPSKALDVTEKLESLFFFDPERGHVLRLPRRGSIPSLRLAIRAQERKEALDQGSVERTEMGDSCRASKGQA